MRDQREDKVANKRKVRSGSTRYGECGHCGVKGRKHRDENELKGKHPEGRPNIRGARDVQVVEVIQGTNVTSTRAESYECPQGRSSEPESVPRS